MGDAEEEASLDPPRFNRLGGATGGVSPVGGGGGGSVGRLMRRDVDGGDGSVSNKSCKEPLDRVFWVRRVVS